MKIRTSLPAIVLGALLITHLAMPCTATASQTASNVGPAKLGVVDFPISCAPGVRNEFNRGVALLHSFWHDQAFAAFQHVASADPDCAIAYWGEAMTHFHQLLATPSPDDIQAGTAELVQADRAKEKTPRELAYINALHRLFDGYQPEAFQQHASAYSGAMETVAETYPGDLEAQVFYALALLASDCSNDVDLVNPRKAFAILNPLFQKHPDHPGIAHYIIHACDNPQMAQEGLKAARQYAQIAPQVPHALHMPSHIFTRLGLWQDDIASNLASKAAAEAAGLHRGAENRLHAMEFLEYAYLQIGQFDEAQAVATEAATVQPTDVDPRYPSMWASVEARYPALLAIETKNWTLAEGLKAVPGGNSSSQLATLLAQVEAAAHLRKGDAAHDALQQLEALASRESRARDSAAAIEIRAWADFARGHFNDAVSLLQPLAERQAKAGKAEIEIPAREMLAEIQLLSGRPAEALSQYQQSLSSDPNRFNALLGAMQAAEQLGRNRLADKYLRALRANGGHADGTAVKELQRVKTPPRAH